MTAFTEFIGDDIRRQRRQQQQQQLVEKTQRDEQLRAA